jgi:hypothetical protein
MTAPCLSELADTWQTDNRIAPGHEEWIARRAFLAGAEAALRIAKQPDGVQQLRAQIVAIGRTVGTAVERA